MMSNMDKKVYVVISEDTKPFSYKTKFEVHGVFLSKEKAERECDFKNFGASMGEKFKVVKSELVDKYRVK